MKENSAHGSNISLQDLKRAPQGMGMDVRGLEKDTSSHSRQSAKNRYESSSSQIGRLPTPDVSEHGRPPSLHSDGQDFSTHGWSQHPEMSEITDRKFLAKGTCGEVFKGKFRGQIIAIKCLIGQEEADTSAHSHKTNNTFTNLRRDFFHEVRVHSALNHPNVVSIHGYNTGSRPPFIIFEFMGGGTLEEYIRNRNKSARKWSPGAIWVAPREITHPWICDMLRALVYLHEGVDRKIIHRDLKPANVMLTSDFAIVKLTDFGLSRRCEAKNDGRPMTGDTGTMRYMAPEVYRKDPIYTEKVDVFSLSMIMFYLATGLPAYVGESDITRVVQKVAFQGFRPPLDRCEWPALSKLIEQAWSHDASQRPSARQLLAMMQGLEGSPPPGAPMNHSGAKGECCVVS